VGHVANEGKGEMHTGFWWGTREGENNLENLEVDGIIIPKWTLKK
jgi:hypothetical protein